MAALICDYLFVAPFGDWAVSMNDGIVIFLFVMGGGVIVWAAGIVRMAARALRRAASVEYELNAELKHHVNNNLAVKTELLDHISEKDAQQAKPDYVGQVGRPAETLARLVAFAINGPEDVGINELLFRPTAQELSVQRNSSTAG